MRIQLITTNIYPCRRSSKNERGSANPSFGSQNLNKSKLSNIKHFSFTALAAAGVITGIAAADKLYSHYQNYSQIEDIIREPYVNDGKEALDKETEDELNNAVKYGKSLYKKYSTILDSDCLNYFKAVIIAQTVSDYISPESEGRVKLTDKEKDDIINYIESEHELLSWD